MALIQTSLCMLKPRIAIYLLLVLDKCGGDPVYKISSHLEKAEKDLTHITSAYRGVKSNLYTSEDRRSEREERDKRIDELKQQSEKNS